MGIVGILTAALMAAACDGDDPAASDATSGASIASGGGSGTLTGRESLAWDQQADSLESVNNYIFTVFVDGDAAGDLSASCSASSDNGSYVCVAPLPPLSAGAHVLAIRTTEPNGESSSLSAGLSITVPGAKFATATNSIVRALFDTAIVEVARVCIGDAPARSCYQLNAIATGLSAPGHPTELVDGRVAVIDNGRLLELQDGQARPAVMDSRSGSRITDVALAPDAATTREVYVLEAAQTARGRAADVVRYRDVNGVLGQRAVIVPDIPLPATGDPVILVDDNITVAIPRQVERLGIGPGTIWRYDRTGRSAGRTLGNAALAWGPGNPTALLPLAGNMAVAGLNPGGLVLGVLAPGDSTPATVPMANRLSAAGGVRALTRTGQLVLLAAGDGSAYVSGANGSGTPVSLQQVDTKGALVTGLTTTRRGAVVATVTMPTLRGGRTGRVYQLTPLPAPDAR